MVFLGKRKIFVCIMKCRIALISEIGFNNPVILRIPFLIAGSQFQRIFIMLNQSGLSDFILLLVGNFYIQAVEEVRIGISCDFRFLPAGDNKQRQQENTKESCKYSHKKILR